MIEWIKKSIRKFLQWKAARAFKNTQKRLVKEWGTKKYIAALEREYIEKVERDDCDVYKIPMRDLPPLIVKVKEVEGDVIFTYVIKGTGR